MHVGGLRFESRSALDFCSLFGGFVFVFVVFFFLSQPYFYNLSLLAGFNLLILLPLYNLPILFCGVHDLIHETKVYGTQSIDRSFLPKLENFANGGF